MSINKYLGCEGPCINVESKDELYEAIDLLHTQVMDNISEDSPLLKVLSDTMDTIDQLD